MRYLIAIVLTWCTTAMLSAQAGAPAFDAVSIKRSTSASPGTTFGTAPGAGFSMTNGPAVAILLSAFPVPNREIIGLPDWARSERFDVVATAATRPSREDEEAMLRALLADRFTLRSHIEAREIPVFALVLAHPERPLPRTFVRLPVDCAARIASIRRGESVPSITLPNGEEPCGYSMRGGAGVALTSNGMTMARLADVLGGSGAGRVVVDHTGLAGDYAFTLTYDVPRTSDTSNDLPTLVTALQEQLGLKLESARAPVETLVIDRIERPTEN